MSLQSVNPATARTIERYPEMARDEVDAALEAAHACWLSWRETSFDHRAALLQRAAAVLRARADELARLMAEEMGKPVRQGRSEVEKCAWACTYYAENGAAHLAKTIRAVAEQTYRVAAATWKPLQVQSAVCAGRSKVVQRSAHCRARG